jgi:hypothetical protein
MNMREEFNQECLKRDNNDCVVPWCTETADDVHHIIDRDLWTDGGYIPENGASVCNFHHKKAEKDIIPPQAFWYWIGVEPKTPNNLRRDINKWGEEYETPPHNDKKEVAKYPSTLHVSMDEYKTGFNSLEEMVDEEIIITTKMDGSNTMLLKDTEHPVRARNGSHASHSSFSQLKKIYHDKNLYSKIDENLQIFGEWMKKKHSIHYGCKCENKCDDIGPALDSYFYVFGVFNNKLNLWLSWDEVETIADKIGFPTVPVIKKDKYENIGILESEIDKIAQEIIEEGHEGIIIRNRYPFHYGQFQERLAKYVRANHVDKDEEHWKYNKMPDNIKK